MAYAAQVHLVPRLAIFETQEAGIKKRGIHESRMMALLCDTGLVTPEGSVQITYSQTVRESKVIIGLCIECAVRHPGFREILGRWTGDDLLLEAPLPEAWIDGRRYRLLLPIGNQEATCSACKRRVPGLYVPAG